MTGSRPNGHGIWTSSGRKRAIILDISSRTSVTGKCKVLIHYFTKVYTLHCKYILAIKSPMGMPAFMLSQYRKCACAPNHVHAIALHWSTDGHQARRGPRPFLVVRQRCPLVRQPVAAFQDCAVLSILCMHGHARKAVKLFLVIRELPLPPRAFPLSASIFPARVRYREESNLFSAEL